MLKVLKNVFSVGQENKHLLFVRHSIQTIGDQKKLMLVFLTATARMTFLSFFRQSMNIAIITLFLSYAALPY